MLIFFSFVAANTNPNILTEPTPTVTAVVQSSKKRKSVKDSSSKKAATKDKSAKMSAAEKTSQTMAQDFFAKTKESSVERLQESVENKTPSTESAAAQVSSQALGEGSHSSSNTSRLESHHVEPLQASVETRPETPSMAQASVETRPETPSMAPMMASDAPLNTYVTPRSPSPHVTPRSPSPHVTPRSPSPHVTPRSPSPPPMPGSSGGSFTDLIREANSTVYGDFGVITDLRVENQELRAQNEELRQRCKEQQAEITFYRDSCATMPGMDSCQICNLP